jgi:hypothetical protein
VYLHHVRIRIRSTNYTLSSNPENDPGLSTGSVVRRIRKRRDQDAYPVAARGI